MHSAVNVKLGKREDRPLLFVFSARFRLLVDNDVGSLTGRACILWRTSSVLDVATESDGIIIKHRIIRRSIRKVSPLLLLEMLHEDCLC